MRSKMKGVDCRVRRIARELGIARTRCGGTCSRRRRCGPNHGVSVPSSLRTAWRPLGPLGPAPWGDGVPRRTARSPKMGRPSPSGRRQPRSGGRLEATSESQRKTELPIRVLCWPPIGDWPIWPLAPGGRRAMPTLATLPLNEAHANSAAGERAGCGSSPGSRASGRLHCHRMPCCGEAPGRPLALGVPLRRDRGAGDLQDGSQRAGAATGANIPRNRCEPAAAEAHADTGAGVGVHAERGLGRWHRDMKASPFITWV